MFFDIYELLRSYPFGIKAEDISQKTGFTLYEVEQILWGYKIFFERDRYGFWMIKEYCIEQNNKDNKASISTIKKTDNKHFVGNKKKDATLERRKNYYQTNTKTQDNSKPISNNIILSEREVNIKNIPNICYKILGLNSNDIDMASDNAIKRLSERCTQISAEVNKHRDIIEKTAINLFFGFIPDFPKLSTCKATDYLYAYDSFIKCRFGTTLDFQKNDVKPCVSFNLLPAEIFMNVKNFCAKKAVFENNELVRCNEAISLKTIYKKIAYKLLSAEEISDYIKELSARIVLNDFEFDENDNRYDKVNIKFRDTVIVTNNGKCTHENSNNVIAVFQIVKLDGNIITQRAKASFCADCGDAYIISYASFAELKKKGVILCKIESCIDNKVVNYSEYFDNLPQESLMHKCGYNVNADSCLSKVQRQTVLEHIITNKIMTKMAVISHLSWLIEHRSNIERYDMSAAVSKWQDDIDFVESL